MGVVVLLNNIPHIARASVTGIQMLPIESLLNAAHESHGRIQVKLFSIIPSPFSLLFSLTKNHHFD